MSLDARTMRNLLKYSEGLEALRVHTSKEFNAENLHFYEAVRAFRRKYNSRTETRIASLIDEAKAIFQRFIAESATEQVNLPAEATAKPRKAFLDTFNFPKGINQWIFDDPFQASFDLMVRDTFQRFRLTPVGKDLIAQLAMVEERREGSRVKLFDKPPLRRAAPFLQAPASVPAGQFRRQSGPRHAPSLSTTPPAASPVLIATAAPVLIASIPLPSPSSATSSPLRWSGESDVSPTLAMEVAGVLSPSLIARLDKSGSGRASRRSSARAPPSPDSTKDPQ